ncbi:MAG: hypothetical protein AAGJ89_11075, partial [Pseudomonadota bacterium]
EKSPKAIYIQTSNQRLAYENFLDLAALFAHVPPLASVTSVIRFGYLCGIFLQTVLDALGFT